MLFFDQYVLKKEQKIAKYLLYTNTKFIIIEVVFIEFGIVSVIYHPIQK
jgi:hypothetical protein